MCSNEAIVFNRRILEENTRMGFGLRQRCPMDKITS
jgi:hypothetical protein